KHYQLIDCQSDPKPLQKRRPPILCAATSDTGLRFTIAHADASLVNGADLDDLQRNGRRARAMAAELGRTTRTVGLVMFVPGASDAEARARVDYFNAGADAEALRARALMYSQGAKEWSRDETLRRETRRNLPDGRTPAAITRNAVVGCPDSLVDQIENVIDGGEFDWLGFYFPDYIQDMRVFGEQVLPKLVARGVGLAHSTAITL